MTDVTQKMMLSVAIQPIVVPCITQLSVLSVLSAYDSFGVYAHGSGHAV